MKSNSNQEDDDEKSLYENLKNNLLSDAGKLRGKFPPISEMKDGEVQVLKIKKIYKLNEELRHFYFFIVKNYEKSPKKRFFLAISLARNSSDFLVFLANNYSTKNDFKLIQYCLNPKAFRISLLALIEIKLSSEIANYITSSKKFRKLFRENLNRIANQYNFSEKN